MPLDGAPVFKDYLYRELENIYGGPVPPGVNLCGQDVDIVKGQYTGEIGKKARSVFGYECEFPAGFGLGLSGLKDESRVFVCVKPFLKTFNHFKVKHNISGRCVQ